MLAIHNFWRFCREYQDIHNNFSFVPQNIYLVQGSVKQNIIFSDLNNRTNDKLLKKSIQLSQLNSFINKNKKGVNRQVGERGLFLSGGQLQRVGIARGIYANRDI